MECNGTTPKIGGSATIQNCVHITCGFLNGIMLNAQLGQLTTPESRGTGCNIGQSPVKDGIVENQRGRGTDHQLKEGFLTGRFASFDIAPETSDAGEKLQKYSERCGKYPLLALLHNVNQVALYVLLEWAIAAL